MDHRRQNMERHAKLKRCAYVLTKHSSRIVPPDRKMNMVDDIFYSFLALRRKTPKWSISQYVCKEQIHNSYQITELRKESLYKEPLKRCSLPGPDVLRLCIHDTHIQSIVILPR